MALSERNRNTLYQGLIRTIEDEEAVEAMLSHFPARDDDEPATEDFVRVEVARLDQRITLGLAETNQRITEGLADLDRRMTEGFAAADQRMTEGFAAADQRMTEGFAGVDVRFAQIDARFAQVDARFSDVTRELKDSIHTEMRRWFLWSYGAMFVLLAAVVTAARILG